MTGADRTAMIVKSDGKKMDGSSDGSSAGPSQPLASSELIDTGGGDDEVEVAAADMVEPEEVSLPEFSEKVHQVARLLAAIEPFDQQVWSLLIDPLAEIKDVRALSRALDSSGTGTQNAYQAVKQIARFLPLKNLLNISDQLVRKNRNFVVEITGFINSAKSNKPFETDSRQLAPLKRVLDHSVGALIRLECLKTNFRFSRELPDEYTKEGVTRYYEEALRSVTDMSDPEIRLQARQRADGDTNSLLEVFRADKFIKQMLETVRTYALAIQEAGGFKTAEDLKETIAEKPLEFQDVEASNETEVPADLLVSGGVGEVFDTMFSYVVTQAWAVMQPVHQPKATAARLREVLRELMVGSLVLEPEMRRHEEQPKIGLGVVCLEKVTGNPSLRDYYVRVHDNGKIAYREDFEDGNFVDLFELREYKPSRVHNAAKKQSDKGEGEELMMGRKYLCTAGRTDRLFEETPSDLLNGCIRAEGGGPKIFQIF